VETSDHLKKKRTKPKSQMSRTKIKSKEMKKIMTIFGVILFASFILTSCGRSSAPDVCDCVKNAVKVNTPQFDANLQKKCADYSKTLSQKGRIERLDEAIRRGCFKFK